MMIPKLAKGGVINNGLPLIYARERGEKIYPLKDKYYQIYKRTNNHRIKKKNMKKSLKAMVEENLKSFNKCEGLSILVNGVPLDKG